MPLQRGCCFSNRLPCCFLGRWHRREGKNIFSRSGVLPRLLFELFDRISVAGVVHALPCLCSVCCLKGFLTNFIAPGIYLWGWVEGVDPLPSIKEALHEAASFLRRQGIVDPRREAELILASLLAQETIYFYAHGEEEFPAGLKARYTEMLQRRGENIPLAYLTGKKEFMGLPFRVKEGVLIPRPETEHLVETVLQWGREIFPGMSGGHPLHILDLGTGCGNIAVSLAYYLQGALVLGVDSSAAALELARQNAQNNGVNARVVFFCGDFQSFFAQNRQHFHVVVSNPPYIPSVEIPFLPPVVQREPVLALDGGEDGLDAYRIIFSYGRKVLSSRGLLALEVGKNQATPVLVLGCEAGFTAIGVMPDLAGRKRVVAFSN